MSSVKELLRGDVIDGSGTADYIPKWSDSNTLTDSLIEDDGTTVSVGGVLAVSGNLTVDTDTLFVDASNNRVGVGISSGLEQALDVDGSINLRGGQIFASADGSNTFFANAVQHIFRAGSSGSFAERMRIDSSGNIQIATTGAVSRLTVNGGVAPNSPNAHDIGTAVYPWRDIYAQNTTIQTSDRNTKQDEEFLNESELRVAVACKSLLKKFRWKSSVEQKGNEARIHFGIIAQDLKQAFENEGLDAGRYAMFIENTFTDDQTGEEKTRLGIRYSELLAFIIAAI